MQSDPSPSNTMTRRSGFPSASPSPSVDAPPMKPMQPIDRSSGAIVRHEGALSLVVPHFARDVGIANFFEQTKIYRFSSVARWVEVSHPEVTKCLTVF